MNILNILRDIVSQREKLEKKIEDIRSKCDHDWKNASINMKSRFSISSFIIGGIKELSLDYCVCGKCGKELVEIEDEDF